MGTGTALVVIDVQNAVIDGDPPAYCRDEVLANIGVLLARARAAKTPVIHIQHQEPEYEPMTPGHPGFEIHPAVAPRDGERRIVKRAADSFVGTPLRAELDALGVVRLVVAGCETDFCVDATVRRALALDYDVTLAEDAHTTNGNDLLSPEQIIAHHNLTLANLAHPTKAIAVMPTEEITF